MIRTCLFDLGNVLVDFSHERMCRQIAAVCRAQAEDIRTLLFDSGLEADFERGRISEQEVHSRIVATFGGPIDFAELMEAGADIFEPPRPAMSQLIGSLKSAGARLVLLSNTNTAHFGRLRNHLGLLDAFDAFVLSCEVGAIKPEAAIYAAAEDVAGCTPAECLYIDDLAANVEAGRRHGFDAELFTTVEDLVPRMRRRGIAV